MLLKIFSIIAISLIFIGCGDPFPASTVYHIDQKKLICDEYSVDQDQVKIKFNKAIPYDQCPSVIGFTLEDGGKVMSWGRRMKKKSKNCE